MVCLLQSRCSFFFSLPASFGLNAPSASEESFYLPPYADRVLRTPPRCVGPRHWECRGTLHHRDNAVSLFALFILCFLSVTSLPRTANARAEESAQLILILQERNLPALSLSIRLRVSSSDSLGTAPPVIVGVCQLFPRSFKPNPQPSLFTQSRKARPTLYAVPPAGPLKAIEKSFRNKSELPCSTGRN